MARNTRVFQQLPWNGGLNDSVDSGLLDPNFLVTCENIIFTTSGARIKRSAHEYFDTDIPAVTHRESSGTTRTLTFASDLQIASPADEILAEGEYITISGGPATYNGTFEIATITANALTYTAGSSLNESSTATSAITVVRADPYVSMLDFWFHDGSTNTKTQQLIVAQKLESDSSFGFKFYKYDSSGRRVEVLPATPATDDDFSALEASRVLFTPANNKLLISFDAKGVVPRVYSPSTDEYAILGGSPPDFFVAGVHQGRVFTNDKANRDRLHYSAPFNEAIWQGTGDSGALDLPRDGDPVGLDGIFPTYRGDLFVGKKQKTYRVIGDSPENYQAVEVSSGLGLESQASVTPVDLDDILYFSERGIHSLQTTANYGDFSGAFLSKKIQNRFNGLDRTSLKNVQGAYINALNSVAFSVTTDDATSPDQILLYNFEVKEWYLWPDLDPRAICKRLESDTPKLYYGNSNSRVVKTQVANVFTDFETDPIIYRLKSGTVYPSGNPQEVVGFKKFTLFYRPKGRFSVTVTVKIDNHAPQSLSFSQLADGFILGDSFVLGESVLAFSNTFAPFTAPIDGFGRGCTIEIEQSGSGQELEIYGFAIEYEPADVEQETKQVGVDD